jgi:hypothetical protein
MNFFHLPASYPMQLLRRVHERGSPQRTKISHQGAANRSLDGHGTNSAKFFLLNFAPLAALCEVLFIRGNEAINHPAALVNLTRAFLIS